MESENIIRGDNCSPTVGKELTVGRIMQEIKMMQIYRLAEHKKVAPVESDTVLYSG